MKKKLALSMLVAVVMMCVFAITISATTIYKDTTVTLNGSFTVGNESVTNPTVNLYDEDGYALVWYLNTDNKLVSDRAVNLITVTDNKAKFNDVSKFYGGSQQKGVIVVNLRDDYVSDGLSTIEKFDSNFQFGYYNAKKSVPIQYFYFPKTATEIIDRMFQETQLIIADIEPGTPITYMGVHAVAMSNLKEFFVPKGIPEFLERDKVGVFESTPLEKITFEEGSQITVIPYKCFYFCSNLKEVVLPNSVEEIHDRAFQFTYFDGKGSLEKLVLGANFKTFKSVISEYYFVRGTSSLKEVYLPATFNADNVDSETAYQLFTICPNAVFYYCGTEEAWDELIENIPLKKSANQSGDDTNAYILDAKANGKVVFNYNPCDAFYNGVHSISQINPCVAECSICKEKTVSHISDYESLVVEYEKGFMANGKKTVACTNEGCSHNVTEEMSALFTCQGYSAPEDGSGAVVIKFTVHADAVLEYEGLTGKTVKYGLFAASKNALGTGDILDENGNAINGSIKADVSDTEYVALTLKMVGFDTDESKEAKFAIGAYVETTLDGNKEYSYLQVGAPENGEKYCFVAYNDVVKKPSTDAEITQ